MKGNKDGGRILTVSCLCTVCRNRENCESLKDIRLLFEDKKPVLCIKDMEVLVFLCTDYKADNGV